MSYPGLPTSLSGAYVITSEVDEECQCNIVTRLGKPFGVWFDDTTPNLDTWIEKARAKYVPLNQKILVAVPPGWRDHHYPAPIISVYEAYIYGMGCNPNEFLPLPKFEAYCVQYKWPGTENRHAPTTEQYDRLLKLVQANHPRFIFLF